MKEKVDTIDILIAKSVTGNVTQEEAIQAKEWKNVSEVNKSILLRSEKVWDQSKIYLSDSEISRDRTKIQDSINKELQEKLTRLRSQNLILKIAAILAVPIAMAISWYFISDATNFSSENQYCEITSPKGNVSKCTLPDGTEVWINTNSTISYNSNSFNRELREILLDGEAYFHVSCNNQKPFTVSTKFGNINVTGTEFNVKSYSGSYQLETVLAEGSIELLLNSNKGQIIKLEPGERAVYKQKSDKTKITKVDAEIYSSWRNGEIIFKDATLNDLIKELQRIYDIHFILEKEEIGEFRFRGMFSYNNNLIDALEKIKKTAELDYIIENKEVKLTKK